MTVNRIISLLACLGLFACSGTDVKDTLGIGRNAPDEYRVVSRPALDVPPEFELSPPATGESNLPAQTTENKDAARSLITGKPADTSILNKPTSSPTAVKSVEASPLASQGDEQFLSNAGATKADPSVRDKLYEDSIDKKKQDDEWYNALRFGWDKQKDDVVDPKKEADRLKEQNIPVIQNPDQNTGANSNPASGSATDNSSTKSPQ